MTNPYVTERTDKVNGQHYLDMHIEGSLRLSEKRVYDWLVLSRVVVPSLPASKEYHIECRAKLKRELAKDAHPAITSARLRGGPECGKTINAIKGALRAKL